MKRNLIMILMLSMIPGTSCNLKSGRNNACKAYFYFDQIEHYHFPIKENKVWELEEKAIKQKNDKDLLAVLLEYSPEDLRDTGVLNSLGALGFKKKILSPTKYEKVGQIFCERKHNESETTTCIAVYRDILIFRKLNKIVGTAKICFDCGKSIIAGASVSTTDFGQSGDYGRLHKLLHG